MAFNKQKNILLILIIVLIFMVPICLNSSDAVGKRSLTHNDYDSWKSITSSRISSDGTWILYIETPQDGEAELVVKSLSKTGVEFRHTVGYSGEGTDAERAASPQFSHDISSVLFLISPSQQEIKEAKKNKKKNKPKKRLGLMALNSGEVTILEKVKSFQIPEKSVGWVSYLKEKEEE